jgi:triacylglycerol lipase
MQHSAQTFKKLVWSFAAAAAVSLSGMGSAIAQSEPVVFVHGYAGSTSNWNTMVSRFTSSGYPSAKLYRFGYNSFVYSNKTSASQLSSYINTVRSNNGYAPVSIIAHSNGGLVSRWFRVKLGGTSKMRRFITLGTPHKGTSWAYGCISPACFEMRYGSSFLNDLAGRGCDRSLWSAWDGVVLPASSAQCGTSIQTVSVNHLALLSDSSVYNQVRQQLR